MNAHHSHFPLSNGVVRPRRRAMRPRTLIVLLLACACVTGVPVAARGAVEPSVPTGAPRVATPRPSANSLESAAARAGATGRAVAMSLIGLAFAVAATVLAFRRDFKEAAGVFAVGIVSVLLATPAGIGLLRDTVTSLFGSQ